MIECSERFKKHDALQVFPVRRVFPVMTRGECESQVLAATLQ